MLSKRYSHLFRLFAIVSLSYFLAACGDGDGPKPVPGEPCPVNGVVSFDSESYAESASSALISLTDTCIANKTVAIKVDNGSETINIDVPIDVSGKGALTVLNFGATSEDTATIAIKEGDILTATYTGASTVVVTDTANITAVSSSTTLGVYTETYTDPVLTYSDILNAADLGGKDTATDEVTATVIAPLDGVNSLRAAFKAENTPPSGGNYNGFVFDFGPALINGTFEADDASGGNVAGATGWTDFEFVFTNNTAGPGFGPVSHDAGGSQSLTMYGPFSFDSASGAYQPDNTVEAGNTYTATAHVMNWNGDNLASGNLGIFQLTFWSAPGGQDGGGTNLGSTEVIVDSTDDATNIYLPPQDGADISDWTELSITEVAPAGTASAEIFLLHIQLNPASDPAAQAGSIFWDDVSIVKGPTAQEPGGDVSSYEVLRFGINSTAAASVVDLEVKLEDTAGNAASVFLSDYTSTPATVTGWDLYEIPLVDFPAGVDLTKIISLGFFNASTTVTGSTSVAPTLVDATLYFDNIHFATGAAGAPPVLTGVLVDAPVEGVTYQTATQLGVTNNLGEFKYVQDETVTFSVGGIVLGTVTGAPLITPVELTGGVNPIDQAAINQLVFLQSIDEDQDPLNGITVSAATLTAAAAQTLDFTLDSAAFTSAVAPVVTAVTSVNPSGPNAVVSETTALDNFYVTYVAGGGTDTFPWSFPATYPPYPGVASFPVDFEDAGAPYYITNFAGGVTTIINNPETTGNSSAKVAQMQKFTDANNYGGSKLTLGTIDFTSNTVFTMKVWASRSVPVTFKLEGLGVERIATHSGSGTWEELAFDFTGFTGEGVREVSLIFDNGVVGDAAGDAANWTFYYDDIALQASAPITYQLIWSDEFDVDGVPDTDNWTIETGYGPNNDGWGNQEWQLYTTSPDNIKVQGGNLVITADCPTAPTCGVRDDTVTSGKVNSLNKFTFRYGKVEAMIKPPVGRASWPAFWMLGKNFPDVGWPFTGEVDIVEMFQTNGSNPQTTHFTIHWCDDSLQNPATPDVCFPSNEGWTFYTDQLELAQSLGDDYHLFSAEWDASGITGKIDGVPYFYRAIDPGTMDEFLKEFFLILNVAMGGTLGSNVQPPDGSETWPQIMLVDYVRVYQDVNNNDSTFTIGSGTSPDPLGVYSETNTNPAVAYSIVNVADFGGKDTDINENSSDTVLEGAVSLRADYKTTGSGPLNYNGFIFDFTSTGASNQLGNASFETPDASGGDVSGAGTPWNSFNSNFTVSNLINNNPPGSFYNPDAHSGTQLLKQFGTDAGSFQDLPASPGETWEASAWAQSWAGDPNNNTGLMQIFFRTDDGTPAGNLCDPGGFGPCAQAVFDTSQPVDTWVELTTSAVAPAGTTTARIQLILVPDAGTPANGSLFWDDASLSPGGGGANPDVDISDYEVLKFGINTAAASGLMDLEIKMEDSASAAASVFLSAYTSTPGAVAGWELYEIPLSDFSGIDLTRIVSLGYWSASSTVTGSTAVPPTLLDGTLYFDDIHFDQAGAGGSGNLLGNASFETPDASGGDVPGAGTPWNSFNSNFTVSNLINNNPPGSFYNPDAHSGTQLLKQFGTDAGSFQDLPASPGETWEASAWAQSWAGDPNNNTGLMQIFFRTDDGSPAGNLCDPGGFGPCAQAVFDTSQPVDTWVELMTSAVAPAGTTTVRIQLILVPDAGTPANGSLFWDDASLSKTAP